MPGPVNFLMSPSVPAAVFASYLLGESPEHLINAGAEQLLDKVHLREGSVLQPRFPAPLGLRGITLMRHMAVCLGLIATATQGEAMAAHSAYVIWYLRDSAAMGARRFGEPVREYLQAVGCRAALIFGE